MTTETHRDAAISEQPQDQPRHLGREQNEAEAKAADRVVAFTDAVIAIAITLLALELPVPAGAASMTNGQLLSALNSNKADYIAFLISFWVIGNYWSTHRRIFRYVNRLDGQVTTLNTFWLLMVTLIPFAQRMLAGHGGFGVRFSIFAVLQVLASALMARMNREIIRLDLLRPDAPASARRLDNTRSYSIIIGFLASIPLAFVTPWAYALWAVGGLLPNLLQRRSPRAGHAGRHGG